VSERWRETVEMIRRCAEHQRNDLVPAEILFEQVRSREPAPLPSRDFLPPSDEGLPGIRPLEDPHAPAWTIG